MMRHAWKLSSMLVLLLAIAGCGRQGPLNVEKEVQLGALGDDNIQSLPIPARAEEQKVSVLVRTNSVPVDVFVVLDKDASQLNDQLSKDITLTASMLAKKEKLTEGTLEAAIPANSGFKVFLVNRSSKKATASVKIGASK